ncbi:MAG: sigma-70 family RNA polymerase sigma factor [Pirellulales bacterium]
MLGVSPALLGELLDRHGAALVLFARQFCASPEDVVQEAFVQLARQSDVPDRPAAWLYRVVRNGAISAARAQQRRRKHEAAAATRARAWFLPTEAAQLGAESATEALKHLSLEEREIIIAHLWGALTFQQIGELVGLSAATAYRRYERGLRALRTILGKGSLARPASGSDEHR